MIAFLITLYLLGPLGSATQDEGHCARFILGTPNSIPEEKAEPRELQAWSSVPTQVEYLQIFHDLQDFLIKAPQEVRDVLGMVCNLTHPDPARDAEYAKRISDRYMVADLEVLFGREAAELAAPMRTLESLRPTLSESAQTYLDNFTAHPSRAYVLALILHSLNEDLKRQTVDPDHQRIRSGTNWLPPQRTLRQVMTSTESLTQQFVRSYHRLSRPAGFSDNDNGAKSSVEPEPDVESMIAWVAHKIYYHDLRAEPERPVTWHCLHKEASEFLKTPVSQNAKVHTVGTVEITQSILTPSPACVAAILEDFDRRLVTDFHDFFEDLLLSAPVGDDRVVWNRDRLDFAYDQERLKSPWGVTLFASMLNLTEPVISGKDLPVLAINQLRRIAVQRMKENYPVIREITHEKAEPTWGPHFESPLDQIFQPATETPVADNENADLGLKYFADGTVPLKVLRPDTRYAVEFKRPAVNFGGTQTFKFSKKALEAMLDDFGRSIPPTQWLEAICDGLARDFGQSGIKILKSQGEGLRFEVKILSSPYRIFGHRTQGEWVLEYIADEH